ncbi:hypothetical protein [Flavobacterium solisilvae]|uniref:Uncharacterized protein n=1 Tax=Flavobacterium solisilvae TaxID=1852019 RepID=A0ABX1QTI7_9FLAO|nr:hypothetical protein [Flavobacterium solisilvae]NMH25537.1 hypothetical protein [Flavobacterium solisilvae]
MKEYQFYDKSLTIEGFEKFLKKPLYNADLVKILREEYPNKKFYLSTRLLKREYIFLCEQIYGSEKEFLIYNYGKILAGKLYHIKTNIEDWKKQVISEIKLKLAFKSKDVSDDLKPILLSTTKLFGQINSKFVVTYRNKVGDNDTMSAYYDVNIGQYNFREGVVGLSEYSIKPFELAQEYKKKAVELNNDIDNFNMKFISDLYLIKILNFEDTNFQEYLEQTLDTRYCFDIQKFLKLKSNFTELINSKIQSQDYNLFLIPKKYITNPQNFFEINDLNTFKKTKINSKDLQNWGITIQNSSKNS